MEAHLAQRTHDAERGGAKILPLRHGVVSEVPPRRGLGGPPGLLTAGFAEREALAAIVGLGNDQSFVLEQLQRRIDGARAGAPDATGAAFQLADHLVTVHRALGQKSQHRRSYVLATPAART